MPNILDDGLLDQAFVVRTFANNPTNADFQLQSAIGNAITAAAQQGLGTVAIATAAYSTTIVQAMIQRLINIGYATATLSGTTLTVTW